MDENKARTVTISTDEYRSLVMDSAKLKILESYLKTAKYADEDLLMNIIEIKNEEQGVK